MLIQSCLHPIRVIQPNGRVDYVGCGKCPACINAHALAWSQRLSVEIAKSYKTHFVTFTYSDEFVPKAYFLDNFVFHSIDLSNLQGINKFAPLEFKYQDSYVTDCMLQGSINVVCHTDVINLAKSFRQYAKRYFIVEEYGPSTFRPHLHGLFFYSDSEYERLTKDTSITDVLCFYNNLWQSNNIRNYPFEQSLGYVSVSEVYSKSAASYVAQYLNCRTDLPLLLSEVFSCKSFKCTRPRLGLRASDQAQIADIVTSGKFAGYYKQDPVSGFRTLPAIESYNVSTIYPRLAGLDCLSTDVQESLISKLSKLDIKTRQRDYIIAQLTIIYKSSSQLRSWFDDHIELPDIRLDTVCNYVAMCRQMQNIASKYGLSLYDYLINRRKYLDSVASNRLRMMHDKEQSILNDPYEQDSSVRLLYDYVDRSYYDSGARLYNVPLDCDYSLADSNEFRQFEHLSNQIYLDNKKTRHSNSTASKHNKQGRGKFRKGL